MSSSLVQVTIALSVGQQPLPLGSTFANISVVVIDPVTGAQPTVSLTGAETPTPWAFTTSVNPGNGSVSATALNTMGGIIAGPVTQTFTEVGSPPATFPAPLGITVTPAAS